MVTEEELANMSPEQIAEMQKQNCIFCHIVSGKVASKKIDPKSDPVIVVIMRLLEGIKAFRRACELMTFFSGTPLARAVRI